MRSFLPWHLQQYLKKFTIKEGCDNQIEAAPERYKLSFPALPDTLKCDSLYRPVRFKDQIVYLTN